MVTAKIAGMESTAKMTSVVSTITSTTNSGVATSFVRSATHDRLADEELLAVVAVGDRQQAAHQLDHRVGFDLDALLLDHRHADAGVHEEGAEHVEIHSKRWMRNVPIADHRAAQHQRAEDAPEEDLVCPRICSTDLDVLWLLREWH